MKNIVLTLCALLAMAAIPAAAAQVEEKDMAAYLFVYLPETALTRKQYASP